jgi:unsaturated rhamnogalacturonyl hydrolase
MRDGHGGVVIGSEISGGCRNVFVENCRMDSPNLERVLRLKSNAMRGGTIENVYLRKTTVGRVASAVLQIDFLYEEGANGPYRPSAHNIVLDQLTVSRAPRVLDIAGFPGAVIDGIRFYHCGFESVQSQDSIRGSADVKLVDCRAGGKPL